MEELLQASVPHAEDDTYEQQSFTIIITPDEVKTDLSHWVSEARTMIPFHYKDEQNVDVSPLLHPLSVKTEEVANIVAQGTFGDESIMPLPSFYFGASNEWRLGRNHKGTCDYIALVALAPVKVTVFAFNTEQRAKWIDMTYAGNATLFKGNAAARQLHFQKSTCAIFEEHLQYAQTHTLDLGEVMICHAAMPWKLTTLDETNPALVHAVHFAQNADVKLHQSSWRKLWEQKGYLNPLVDFGGLCKHFSVSSLIKSDDHRFVVPATYVAPPWLPVEANPWTAFESARNMLTQRNPVAWNTDWEATTRSHAPGTKQFNTAMTKLMSRVENMFEKLDLLAQEQAALATVRHKLDEVPVSVRDGNLLRSWNKLNRIYGEHNGKLIAWIAEGKSKGSELLEETETFLKRFCLKINLKPYVDQSVTRETMVACTEAKIIVTEVSNLLSSVFKEVKTTMDQTTRDSFTLMRSHLNNMYENIKTHFTNSAYMYDVSVIQHIKEYLMSVDSLVKLSGKQEEDKADDDDDDDDENEEDEEDVDDSQECGPFASLVSSLFKRNEAFDTAKKSAVCYECERKAMLYKKAAVCNRCAASKLVEAANYCAKYVNHISIDEAKVIVTEMQSKQEALAKQIANGKDGDIREYSVAIFTQVDRLKLLYKDLNFDGAEGDFDPLDVEDDDDDSAVVSDNASIEYSDDEEEEEEEEEELPKRKKRGRSDEDRNAIAHELIMAMAHTPVASTLKPTILAYRDGKYEFINNAVKMLKLQPVLYAVTYPSGEYKEMFLTEEEALKACRPDQKVLAVKQEERWPIKEGN